MIIQLMDTNLDFKILSLLASSKIGMQLIPNEYRNWATIAQLNHNGKTRIIKINDLIARANVVDVTKLEKKDNVIFGSTVYLLDLESNIKKTYKIVGKDEADAKKNYIYFRSPVGKALIGKNKKDMVMVTTPSGEKNFEIIEVKYI